VANLSSHADTEAVPFQKLGLNQSLSKLAVPFQKLGLNQSLPSRALSKTGAQSESL